MNNDKSRDITRNWQRKKFHEKYIFPYTEKMNYYQAENSVRIE